MSHLLLLLGGACQGLMTSFNGSLSGSLSLMEVCFIVHGIGAVMLLGYILLRRERIALAGAPRYVYLVGFMGVAMVVSSSFCASRIGAALTMAISVAASALVDHFGWFGVPVVRWTWKRVPPCLVILAGLALMMW